MTLEEIYYVSQLIASVAVVASILYLALQTRLAAKSQHSAARQARTNRAIDMSLSIALEPSLAEVCRVGFAGDESLSAAQLAQFQSYCGALFISSEDSFLAHRSGAVDDDTFKSIVQAQKQILRSPGARVMWQNHRRGRHPAFVTYYDKLMAETPLADPVDLVGRWKEGLAGMRAQAAQQASPQTA